MPRRRRPAAIREELGAARERLAQAGCPVPAVETMARYGWVARVVEGVVDQPESSRSSPGATGSTRS